MRKLLPVCATLIGLIALTACQTPPGGPVDPGSPRLYLDVQPDITPVVTPQARPVTWGSAAPIDDRYGQTLYPGTPIEQPDPRPALNADGTQPLRMWIAQPDDGRTGRPAILWFHGGGFAVGIDSMFGSLKSTGVDYARRGYVSLSVEYRIDTSLGEGRGADGRPPSLCQWVQDNQDPGDPTWVEKRDQCLRNMRAAQQDALAAVRWVRANADRLGVDPDRVVVAGMSAGAVTASNSAYQFDDIGTHAYFAGDPLTVAASRPNAAFGASGCTYSPDGGVPATIGAGDVPIALIASERDPAVPYPCVATTVLTARSAGLVAELISYCGEAGHAQTLYKQHQKEVDAAWTTFLARELGLVPGMRPPSTDPVC